jgi:NAD(P)-binding Rossmann-like domain/Flavin containing amine oxidoreductase
MAPTQSGQGRKVYIVGAGIAGMTAALYLAGAGFEVTLLEQSDHVGGKFGAVPGRGGAVHEHAYHFLGDWCVNFWELVDAIGLKKKDDFRPSLGVGFLRPKTSGKPFAERLSLLQLSRIGKDLIGSLDGGVIPPDDLMIWFYSLLDLIASGQELDEKEFLNRISVNGFMRSLPYMTDLAALLHQEAMVKAFAVPSYETSARSYRQFARFFSRDQDGCILNAPVSERFWPQFTKALATCRGPKGAPVPPPVIRTGVTVEAIEVEHTAKGWSVSAIRTKEQEQHARLPLDRKSFLLVTAPHGDVATIVEQSAPLRQLAPGLLSLRRLPSRQMASLDLYFRKPLMDVPAEHVTLIDDGSFKRAGGTRKDRLAMHGNRLASRFSLSFVDNYQAWHHGPRRETWLNIVATDFAELAGLPKEAARSEIQAELARYLDFDPRLIDQERSDLQLNDKAPLFTNSVGTWQDRPEPGLYREPEGAAAFQNLGLAGDYCRSEVDIVCLEGAILTARRAARAIAKQAGCEDAVADPPSPAEVNQRLIQILKQDWAPWLRLAVRGSLGARLSAESQMRDALLRAEDLKTRLDLRA